jgi:hypothetical protein
VQGQIGLLIINQICTSNKYYNNVLLNSVNKKFLDEYARIGLSGKIHNWNMNKFHSVVKKSSEKKISVINENNIINIKQKH